jgi:hypothetical protein
MGKHGSDSVVRASENDAISLQDYSIQPLRTSLSETSPSYTPIQQEDSADPDNPKVIRKDGKKPRLNRVFRSGWGWEIGAVLVAIASTSAIVVILVRINGKSIASWPYTIQPASLVAVFSSIAKSTLLVPVAICLGQLKWSYFEKPRELVHMQVFDDASRGPWGALVLLWKTRGMAWLAGIGALVTVLLMTFEPFSQQAINFDEKVVLLNNATGGISVASTFTDEPFIGGAEIAAPRKLMRSVRYGHHARLVECQTNHVVVRLNFTIAMMQAMANTSTIYEFRQCPEKDCSFKDFASLGACTRCDTELVQINNEFGCTYYTSSNTTDGAARRQDFAKLQPFAGAVRRDLGQNLSTYGMDCNHVREGFPPLNMNMEVQAINNTLNLQGLGYLKDPSTNVTALSDTAVFGNTYYRTDGDYIVTTIKGSSFRFCASGSSNNSKAAFDTIDTFTCLETYWDPGNLRDLDHFGEFKANVTHCRLSMCAREYRNVSILNNVLRTAPISETPLQQTGEKARISTDVEATATIDGVPLEFQIGSKRMGWLIAMIETVLYSTDFREFMNEVTTKDNAGWPDVFERVSTVVSGYMRTPDGWSTSVQLGTVYASQTFFKVTWAWLVMPFLMVFASMAFLTATAVYSHRKTYLFKNSMLAAMRYGVDGWQPSEKSGKMETDVDLAKTAEGVRARFVLDGHGELRFVREE